MKRSPYRRPQADILAGRLAEPRRHIQVLAGPRQVGKTTLVQQVVEGADLPVRLASADEPTLRGPEWIDQQWQAARLAEWQRAAIELAMTIATRLLHERVLSGDFPMESKVRDMIAQLGDDPAVTVRLHPADLQLLKSRMRGGPLIPDQEDPKFLPDPALGRGECRVEGQESMLLSEVSRELQEIRDELLRSLGNARS